MKAPVAGSVIALLVALACSSSPQPTSTLPRHPCGLIPRSLVASTLGPVTFVRRLHAGDFMALPGHPFAACAYGTKSPYGQFGVFVGPMTHEAYERQYESDPRNEQPIGGLGEAAVYQACSDIAVYDGGRVIQVGVQLADCGLRSELMALARAALR